MNRVVLALVAVAGLAQAVSAASPVFHYHNRFVGPRQVWHRGWYDPMYSSPYGIVVPRRAHLQTNWGWGVTGTSMTPIYNEYHVPAGGIDGEMYLPTPAWPSHTDQFGASYVRTPRQ